MRRIAIGLALLAAACEQDSRDRRSDPLPAGAAAQATALRWAPDEDAAFADAGRTGRGVLVFATAAWCAPCAEEKRVLHDPEVARGLGRWVAVEVDLTDDNVATKAAKARYQIETLPFLGFYDGRGTTLARITDYVDAAALARRAPRAP
jgi:thiol:disulfide interchange protein